MKKILFIFRSRFLAFSMLLILAGSCLDYTVKTRVNKDGSIYREYLVRGDSADVFQGSLRIPSGNPWQISHLYDHKDKDDSTSDESQYVYKASRTFKNQRELNQWMDSDTSRTTEKIRVSLKKSFRWFYTYYDYRETFPMSFPFQKIPVDSFLTELEQAVIKEDPRVAYSPAKRKMIWKKDTVEFQYNPKDSLEMKKIIEQCEEKTFRWMTASYVEEFISLLETHFGDNPATRQVRQLDDQLTDVVFKKTHFMSLDSLGVELLITLGDSLLGAGGLKELYAGNRAAFLPIREKLEHLDFLENTDDYYQSLTLPGTVFSTNADEVKGAQLNWDFSPESFMMKDYEMYATSRTANPWIISVTGVLAVLLAIVLFLGRKK
ncbi:MAG: hypothetical protein JW830_02660 [Bacteroidales bacterium]|nr:hypothetical protein [Bacteroidales bacterium]